MAQFKNNQFTSDTHDEHSLRVDMCITGMETYEGEVGFRGTAVDDMKEHQVDWNDIRTGLADEWGEQKGATVLVKLLKAELHDLIIDCRFMLYSMLDEEDLDEVVEHDIRKAYGLLVKIPQDVEGKIELARVMAELNQGYIDDGSPYALPAGKFGEMADKGVELKAAVNMQAKEILDVYHMNKMLEMERKQGDKLLSRTHKWLVAVWDDNDERLFAFGMLPKSAIWTEGDPEPPLVELPEWPGPIETLTAEYLGDGTVEVKYTSVQEATIATIEYREAGTEIWQSMFDNVTMNPDDIVPLRHLHFMPGDYEIRFTPFRDGEAGEQTIIELHIPE